MRKVYLGVGERYPCESVRHARNATSILVVCVHLFLHKIYCRCSMSVCTTVVQCYLQEVVVCPIGVFCEDARNKRISYT
jgi:hypothetical protein